MKPAVRLSRAFGATALSLALLAAGLTGLAVNGTRGPSQKPPKKAAVTEVGAPMGAAAWNEVDRLVNEQKMEEASALVARIRLAARAALDEDEWAKALVREVQLRTALHGYETSVRFLKEEPWPKAALPKATLDLFYASSLVTYQQAYSWEIGQREKLESKGAVDLKAFTRDEIYAEAERAFLAVWRLRDSLGKEPVARLSEYVAPNNYPEGVRGTLRDAATYLFVEFLADTTGWRPEQSNELFALDVKSLAAGDPAVSKLVKLDDRSVHPLVKIGALLDDLEAWHAGKGERAGALEARLERLRRLHAAFTEEADRDVLKKDLERHLPAFRQDAWWAMGKAQLAEFVREESRKGSLVRARAIALQGLEAYPDSMGGERCRHIVKSIEAPDFRLAAMASDGPGKRSLEVTHKNLPALFFRAWRVDLPKRLETARDYNLLPSGREVEDLLKSGSRAAEWSVELPATPDYKLHRTFVTPLLRKPGLYVVAVSARKGFSRSGNRILAVDFLVTDLVIVTRPDDGGGVEVTALSGATGRPVAGAEVFLYKYDWQQGHHRVASASSDANGAVRFPFDEPKGRSSHFVFARKGADLALDPTYVGFHRPSAPAETTASLLYTDRSVYRPLQKLFFKVVAYRGSGATARFAALPVTPVSVSLVDPNNETVESRTLVTNAFGSAAGEFTIPSGRVLGAWHLRSSLSGQTNVRVEEYKRPTFEASLLDPKDPLRLNRPATLRGEARYYFGLPVVNGAVRWRVTREPVYPWWWGWWGWGVRGQAAKTQTIAVGKSILKEDGSFELSFTPRADERTGKGSKEVTYRFQVAADVTDEGGETRSAARSFRLGFVAVEARISTAQAFLREGTDGELTILRTDLDGVPRPGKGTWRLVRLRQPERALLPAEQTAGPGERGAAEADEAADSDSPEIRTPGDRLRPRWAGNDPLEKTLRSWADGPETGKGATAHGEKGEAKIVLRNLEKGAYRLHYETDDDFGARYRTSKDFLVASRGRFLNVAALLLAESGSVEVGGTARLLVLSGLPDQLLLLEVFRAGKLVERRRLESGKDAELIEIPVGEKDRGGFGVTLTALRDHQFLQSSSQIFVPWDDKELKVEFATFRDRLRPGAKETWRVSVKGHDGAVEKGAAEVLSYMYDRSLDVFAPHMPPSPLSLYPYRAGTGWARASLGQAPLQWLSSDGFPQIPLDVVLRGDRLKFYDSYGIGGPGVRGGVAMGRVGALAARAMAPAPSEAKSMVAKEEAAPQKSRADERDRIAASNEPATPPAGEAAPLRSNFAETAFWKPHLLTEADGSATFEFTVPDSVTSWNVWVHALTRDLRGGSLKKETKSVKELMVRPYVPRFLREGDQAEIKVVVNNASERELSGHLSLEILDPATNASLGKEFGLAGADAVPKAFTVKPGGGTNLTYRVTAPKRVGPAAFKVTATAGDVGDGELRPVPVLPGRIHLVQSRFVTLRNKDKKTLRFDDLAKDDDPTRVNDQMVVTVDAQLFYTVLQALPYLVNYPYECTEQTLNRFVSTGIVSKLYVDYPAVGRMAAEMSKRTTPLETWDAADPNRKMALEETPWLETARGGKDAGEGLTNVLDPRIAKADRDVALAKLKKAQTANGAFPWWPGGPPSPYMTLYIMHGFAKAAEFGVDVPKDVVQRGWQYLASHWRDDLRSMMAKDCCWEFFTFLNYVASCYPDDSWTGNALTPAERKEILDYSFQHWKRHSPYLKGYLSLTLRRMGRVKDAELVWESVMDSSKTNEEQGTFWAPEDRSWLWYNDTIETHAFALRTLLELHPADARKDGLVQWLLLNKKLNQWKSTRATAEVIYSLVHYLKREGALGIPEDATVTIGTQKVSFTFEPEKYTGKKNQVVVPGEKVDPKTMSAVVVEKESKGFAFASATWHFSTERLPAEDRGDFFSVSRRYYRRENTGREVVLKPLAEGAVLKPGDQVEVQISLRTKHEAEYVHLRDPRAAGLEPENAVSRHRWDLGIGWYEETRDSGANFFFERLPVGEYTFKYRLRANMSGTFRVGPATVQSMYAPEFNAYSAGNVIRVGAER